MLQYRVNGKCLIPKFLYIAVSSWVVMLVFFTVLGIVGFLLKTSAHVDLQNMIPQAVVIMLDIGGAYTAFGSIFLWLTMWAYWIAVERGRILVRAGWFLLLILGFWYGALIYGITVWTRGLIVPVEPPQIAC
jgi:hypothetical protein